MRYLAALAAALLLSHWLGGGAAEIVDRTPQSFVAP